MKKLLMFVVLFISIKAQAYNDIWQQVSNRNVPAKGTPLIRSTDYAVFSLNITYLKGMLQALPFSADQAQIIELPQPDGTYRTFKVWQCRMMEKGLAEGYPGIKTFTAVALDNAWVTAKLDFTLRGFHAMIFDGGNTSFIDPYSNKDDNYYIVHYKKNEFRYPNETGVCQFKSEDENGPAGNATIMTQTGLPQLSKISNGYQSRTYRLALACSNQYATTATGMATPAIADVLSAMTTSMNRINGVYEREFSITMVLVANDTSIIFTSATNDPYGSINTNPNALCAQNQKTCDTVIGNDNYDIGHVFTTNGGGLSSLGCVCHTGSKASSETGFYTPVGDGFDIDYVAHEMGHEFGADHPFNNGSDGSCGGGNMNRPTAYEPGSGSTIMAYAGICSPDDLQPHSDAYFHAISLNEIYTYSILGRGNNCAVQAATNNTPASLPSFAATYSIPYKTPFELIAPVAVDTAADSANRYCWEQWNLGDAGSRLVNTHFAGPIFRSFNPDLSGTRIFPKIDSILKGTYSYVSTGSGSKYENHEGEKVPDTARFLTFKLTERAILNGYGSFLFPDDTVHLDVINTGAAFAVTSQNKGYIYWQAGATDTITWNVVGTDAAPINCDSVNIYLSVDGGYSWPYLLGEYPNNGFASVVIPSGAITNTARLKVKGANNVFFNVNRVPIVIGTVAPNGVANVLASQVKVYPSPATDVVHIESSTELSANIYNELGQRVYTNSVNGNLTVSVSGWAKGIYYVELSNIANGQRVVKPVVVN